jgi:hypothetical protein
MNDSHRNLTDEQFEQAFADSSLPPEFFDHGAHLRLGFIHLKKYDKEQAINNVCEQILRFDETHGKGDKYDYQLTIAAMLVIDDAIVSAGSRDFDELLGKRPDLLTDFGRLISEKIPKQT